MKKMEERQRFYIWDFIWWQGERWQQERPASRVNGSTMLFGYIIATAIMPLILLSVRLFPNTKIALLILWSVAVIAGHSLIARIYRIRAKAVLKHYSKRRFYPIVGIMLQLISLAMILAAMYCLAGASS